MYKKSKQNTCWNIMYRTMLQWDYNRNLQYTIINYRIYIIVKIKYLIFHENISNTIVPYNNVIHYSYNILSYDTRWNKHIMFLHAHSRTELSPKNTWMASQSRNAKFETHTHIQIGDSQIKTRGLFNDGDGVDIKKQVHHEVWPSLAVHFDSQPLPWRDVENSLSTQRIFLFLRFSGNLTVF